MLSSFHDLIKGWVSKVLFIIIAITFAFIGTHSFYGRRDNGDVKVTIGDTEITAQQIQRTYQRLYQQFLSEAGPDHKFTPNDEKLLKQRAQEQMINRTIMEHAARDQGYAVSLAQTEAALMQIPTFQEEGKFSKVRYQQALQAGMYTPDSFMAQLQRGILVNQIQAGIMATEFTLPEDLQQVYQLAQQTRDFRYIQIPAQQFARDYSPSEADQKAYYQKHKELFKTADRVKLAYVLLSQQALTQQFTITDKDAKDYYDANIANYQTPAKWQVAHILVGSDQEMLANSLADKARGGDDFGALAQKHSIDKLSAAQGGKLPLMGAGDLPKTIAEPIMELHQIGQVVGPVATKYGFEIIKCLSYQKPKPVPFATVSKRIKIRLVNEKAQQRFANLHDELANISYQNPDSLDPVAEKLKLKVQNTDWFSAADKGEGITKNADVIKAAFSEDVLEGGNNSDVIQLNDDSVVVIRVVAHEPAKVRPFAQVQEQIQQTLIAKKREQASEAYADEILQALHQQKRAPAFLQKQKLQWKVIKASDRRNKDVPSMINNLAFSLPEPFKQHVSAKAQRLPNGDVVVVELQKIHQDKAIEKITGEQRQMYRTQIEHQRGMLAFQLYLTDLVNAAEVKRH